MDTIEEIKKLNCDNLKSIKNLYSLVMVRGKRRVFIGLFPYRDRAQSVASSLDWEGFKAEINVVGIEV